MPPTSAGRAPSGLMLADHRGKLRFMAASNEQGEMLELFQLQNSEGPCLDCFRSGDPVVNADLTAARERWPLFAPAAEQAGFRSVHAFPMRLRDTTIGALNLFGSADVGFAEHEVKVVQALADVATIALLQERSIARADALTEQLQGALNSRILVEQAKGALAQQEHLTPDQAFERDEDLGALLAPPSGRRGRGRAGPPRRPPLTPPAPPAGAVPTRWSMPLRASRSPAPAFVPCSSRTAPGP